VHQGREGHDDHRRNGRENHHLHRRMAHSHICPSFTGTSQNRRVICLHMHTF
jgi:hypothetical protein